MSTSLSEVNKINLINIQPTTKYVDKNGPSTNPEYYVKKVDLDKQLSNIPTKDNVVSISKNLITNALDNYYDKDYIDGQLSCKSNTDHTHTNIYNELTINSNSFKLLSSKSKYTTFTMGKNDKNYESAVIGYGDDYMGKYLYMRINGGKQLTLYGDRATLEADLTVTSLNGITPSTISLNTHNHDDKYALVDHTHDDKYSKLDHNHNDKYALVDHAHDTVYSKLDHNHDDRYSKLDHNHSYNSLTRSLFKQGATFPEINVIEYYLDPSDYINERLSTSTKIDKVRISIKFFENVQITATESDLTIKVGTKEFKFTESGFKQ